MLIAELRQLRQILDIDSLMNHNYSDCDILVLNIRHVVLIAVHVCTDSTALIDIVAHV